MPMKTTKNEANEESVACSGGVGCQSGLCLELGTTDDTRHEITAKTTTANG